MKSPMKRRKEEWDYSQPRIYMITIAVEGRRPLFGRVAGRVDAPAGSADAPHVELSPLGRFVNAEVEHIPGYYPMVRILGKQVMPDHVHFILHVTAPLPCHLGRVINGYKVGCNRGYREIMGAAPLGGSGGDASPQSGSQRDTRDRRGEGGRNSLEAEEGTASPHSGSQQNTHGRRGERGKNSLGSAAESVALGAAEPRAEGGLLWEHGYHDRILSGPGQLQTMIDYLHDNPRRLLLRRSRPEWLRPRFGVRLGSRCYAAIGNLELLRRPRKAVRVSRRCNETQIAQEVEAYMAAARAGTVLVSPSISPGEKRVMRTAFDAGLPLIVLVENGFTPYTKPTGEQFDACSEGRLLLLAPWEHHTDRHRITATQCQQLNLLSIQISEL